VIGFLAAVQTNATVARPICKLKVTPKVVGFANTWYDVLCLRLEFLKADYASALRAQPGEDAFFDG
jgi:hypothetical protein